MVKALLTIAVLGTVCGGLLSAVDRWTEPHIEANHAAQREAVFRALLPDPFDHRLLATRMQHVDCSSWLAGTVTAAGYGGPMEFAFVADPVTGVISLRNIHHRETPGFGDFISGDWLAARDRSDITDWSQVDNVSGATITTAALKKLAIEQLRSMHNQCRE